MDVWTMHVFANPVTNKYCRSVKIDSNKQYVDHVISFSYTYTKCKAVISLNNRVKCSPMWVQICVE